MRKRKKAEDWRNQKRADGGSIRERNGKVSARIQYFGVDGKRHDKERPARNRTHARELIKLMRAELKHHGETALDSDRMTFRELSAVYEKQRLVPAVIVDGKKVGGLRSYRSARSFLVPLVSYFGRKQIRTINHSDLEQYKLSRLLTPIVIKKQPDHDVKPSKKRAGSRAKIATDDKAQRPKTRQRSIAAVNRELEVMRAMMRFAQRESWILKSPFEKGAPIISKASETQRDRVLTHDEETRLLAACNGKRAHLRGLLVCALDTAMRRGELFKLEWPDVDFAANLIRVRATNTKTERARTVGMTPRVAETLTALRNQAPPNYCGSVFGISDTVKTAWKSALNEAKIAEFRLHDCRHTAITRMIQAGMPAAETMKISGHTQWTTFARYVNVNEEAARKGADLLAAHLANAEAKAKRKANANTQELASHAVN